MQLTRPALNFAKTFCDILTSVKFAEVFFIQYFTIWLYILNNIGKSLILF